MNDERTLMPAAEPVFGREGTVIPPSGNGENGGRGEDGRFLPGNPGGPGRPPGSRNKATLAVAALLDGEAERLARAAIVKALEGDGPVLRFCLDRILPAARDRPVAFAMPALTTAADAVAATAAITAAAADGTLTPSEATRLAGLVGEFVRAFVAHDLEAQLSALEARSKETRS